MVWTSTKCFIRASLAFQVWQYSALVLVVVGSMLVMELGAFSGSLLAFVDGSVDMDLGFDASGCFDNFNFDFYNFG